MKINSHLGMRIFNQPLMIEQGKADVILAALSNKFGLDVDMTPQIRAAMEGDYREAEEEKDIEGIRIIPVLGTLVHRSSGMEAMSGLCSYQALGDEILEAAADPSVKGILLDIDSFGGEVAGCFDLAETIAEVNKTVKPVWAFANEHAFSAAYAIACAAGQLFVARTGGVGSIGVVAEHVDFSKHNAAEGIKVTQVHAGAHKIDLSSEKPLNADGLNRLQTMVDQTYNVFVETVSTNRGLTEETVRATEAQIYFGLEALEANLADGIDTFDNVLNNMIQISKPDSSAAFFQKGSDMRMFNRTNKKAESEMKPTATVETPEEVQTPATAEPAAADAPTAPAAAEPAAAEPAADEEVDAPVDEAERAAAIADIAVAGNMAASIPEFIRSGATVEEIKGKVDSAKSIKSLCKLAGREDAAEGFIAQGLSVQKVQDKLVSMMATEDEKLAVRPTTSPEAATEEMDSTKKNVLLAAMEKRTTK